MWSLSVFFRSIWCLWDSSMVLCLYCSFILLCSVIVWLYHIRVSILLVVGIGLCGTFISSTDHNVPVDAFWWNRFAGLLGIYEGLWLLEHRSRVCSSFLGAAAQFYKVNVAIHISTSLVTLAAIWFLSTCPGLGRMVFPLHSSPFSNEETEVKRLCQGDTEWQLELQPKSLRLGHWSSSSICWQPPRFFFFFGVRYLGEQRYSEP